MQLDINKKVFVKNLCSWGVGFKRICSIGDVSIAANAKTTLSIDEIIAQCQSNNRLFVGNDGKGSHANLFIEDKDVRIEVGFESEDSKDEQDILTEEKVQSMFELKTFSVFKKRIEENIVTDAEKALLIELIKKLKINDHDKIKFVESYTGYKVE